VSLTLACNGRPAAAGQGLLGKIFVFVSSFFSSLPPALNHITWLAAAGLLCVVSITVLPYDYCFNLAHFSQ